MQGTDGGNIPGEPGETMIRSESADGNCHKRYIPQTGLSTAPW